MGKTVFLFPGQGSQYVGMGKSLCEISSAAREIFEEANDALGYDIRQLCFDGDMDELTKTENTQPAVLTVSMAAYRVYMKEIGTKADFTAGHSLGEYSALCCSGALKFYDGVRIVKQRGRFMQEAVAPGLGSMAAISGISQDIIEDECGKISKEGHLVVISNYNSPDQTVISGHVSAVALVSENLEIKGARVVPLKVSAPFHSPLMQPAADRLREELYKFTYSEPACPVLSNVTARPYSGADKIINNLTAQIVQPVRWRDSISFLLDQGVDSAIEMGPQAILKNLMRQNAPKVMTFSFGTQEELTALRHKFSNSGQGSEQNSVHGLDLLTRCIAAAVCTKNHNWDNAEYQAGVVEPYQKIKSMKEDLEKENSLPALEQMREALELLKQIFNTKKVPVEEQAERFNDIFDATGTRLLFENFEIPSSHNFKIPVLQA